MGFRVERMFEGCRLVEHCKGAGLTAKEFKVLLNPKLSLIAAASGKPDRAVKPSFARWL